VERDSAVVLEQLAGLDVLRGQPIQQLPHGLGVDDLDPK
jgi:hypothetical protein